MKTYISLFRGLNMGGHNLLPMKALVKLLEDLGFRNIKTYIQSGNVIFQSNEGNASQLAEKIGAKIKQSHGFAPQVFLLKPGELEKAIAVNPFPEAASDPKSLHVLFLASIPKSADLKALERFQAGSERFKLIGRLFFLHAPDGVGRSKLASNAERLLGVPTTGRNWRTLCAVMEMAREHL